MPGHILWAAASVVRFGVVSSLREKMRFDHLRPTRTWMFLLLVLVVVGEILLVAHFQGRRIGSNVRLGFVSSVPTPAPVAATAFTAACTVTGVTGDGRPRCPPSGPEALGHPKG